MLEPYQVAHRLHVSVEFVRRLIRLHKLPAYRIGGAWRVDPRDLAAYLADAFRPCTRDAREEAELTGMRRKKAGVP